MTHFSTALVTGCGGDIACSLARIARRASMFEKLIGCEVRADHSGLEIFDRCYTVPRATDEGYFERLAEVAQKERADLIIPASDHELGVFARAGKTSAFDGRPVLMASPNVVKIGLDKLATAEFLSMNGLPHPWTVDASLSEPIEYPCIFKPRQGQGGKGFRLLQSAEDLAAIPSKDGIFQQYLDQDEAEFTCGLYRTLRGEIRHIVFRRKLVGGLTGSGIVEADPRIDQFLRQLAEALDLRGSINVQLRMHQGKPLVFEINPRFSSTVWFRDRLGFRDFLWSVQELVGAPLDAWIEVQPGIRIARGFDEIILPDGVSL